MLIVVLCKWPFFHLFPACLLCHWSSLATFSLPVIVSANFLPIFPTSLTTILTNFLTYFQQSFQYLSSDLFQLSVCVAVWANWKMKKKKKKKMKNLFCHASLCGNRHQRVCSWRFHRVSSTFYTFCRSDEAARGYSCWNSRTWCSWNRSVDISDAAEEVVVLLHVELVFSPLSLFLLLVPYLCLTVIWT